MGKYPIKETIKDLKHCIKQFEKHNMFILADMKKKELEDICRKEGVNYEVKRKN